MDTMNERLRHARIKAGFKSARSAAMRFHFTPSTYAAHENGQNEFSIEHADRYARAFDVSAGWILTGEGRSDATFTQSIPVVGYIGAGAEVVPFDDHPMGEGFDRVALPFPVARGTIAGVIRGDSQLPVFEDGDLVGWSSDERPAQEMIGKTCVVRLADGRVLLKKIRRGSDFGLFTLVSSNASDIEDVELEWAKEFQFRIPGSAWRKL